LTNNLKIKRFFKKKILTLKFNIVIFVFRKIAGLSRNKNKRDSVPEFCREWDGSEMILLT